MLGVFLMIPRFEIKQHESIKHLLAGLALAFVSMLAPVKSIAGIPLLDNRLTSVDHGLDSRPALIFAAVKPIKPKVSDALTYVLDSYKVAGLLEMAQEGDLAAMIDLSLHLQYGIGVEKNPEEAVQWCRSAAETGHAGAQNNLGDLYEKGEGVPKSFADAIYWYTQAAMGGEPTAYLSLGGMFAEGMGVKKDLVEGYFWLTLAIKHLTGKKNLNYAKRQRERIEKQMTDYEIATAQRKANDFQPLKQTKNPLGDTFQE